MAFQSTIIVRDRLGWWEIFKSFVKFAEGRDKKASKIETDKQQKWL
jgi:hypothetical protein